MGADEIDADRHVFNIQRPQDEEREAPGVSVVGPAPGPLVGLGVIWPDDLPSEPPSELVQEGVEGSSPQPLADCESPLPGVVRQESHEGKPRGADAPSEDDECY